MKEDDADVLTCFLGIFGIIQVVESCWVHYKTSTVYPAGKPAMLGFFEELWTSILTPGTTPALMKATHASFIALLITLAGLIIATHNLHFVALFFIACCLWASVTWFVNELEVEKARQKAEGVVEVEAETSEKTEETETSEKTEEKKAK